MGNQSSSNEYMNRVGFEDVQKAIYELCQYTTRMCIPSFDGWTVSLFETYKTQITQTPPPWVILNTMENIPKYQTSVFPQTIPPDIEELWINWLIDNKIKCNIIIYGLNTCDARPEKKYHLLTKLGFQVYIYTGGMFEWLLLQDIYGDGRLIKDETQDITHMITSHKQSGDIEFPTTSHEIDILRFRPRTLFPILLQYSANNY